MLYEIFDPKAKAKAVGIDLGTTHSLVATVHNGRPMVIRDCDGEALVPSVVHFGKEVLVGTRAVLRAKESPTTTIFSTKRLMGRGADDPETGRAGPYRFVPRREGEPNVVRYELPERVVTPVEVSAEILRAMRKTAEDKLGRIGGAVITVPAYFDDAQRQATKDAAKLAGLDVLRLLNEPTAAALAYGLEKKKNGTFAVYDLGGGTFDVTILVLEDGVFHVKATGGDSQLGGDDMDRIIAAKLLDAEAPSPERLREALTEARRVKHLLTTEQVVTSNEGVTLSRAWFSSALAPLLHRTGSVCMTALKDAEVPKEKLDGVLLVGGATRVPAVRAYVADIFGREPLSDVNPDEVVALGAAVSANMLSGAGDPDEVLLLDVLPLSLGIEVGGGIVDKILPRNTTIPAAARAKYTTQADEQTGFEIHVVQGERELAKDCRSLARFTLRGIPPMRAGMARLLVTFRVNADGILSVTAREETTGTEQTVDVSPSYGLDDETVESMLLEAMDHGGEDLAMRRLTEARVEASRLLAVTERAVQEDRALLSDEEAKVIQAAWETLRARAAEEEVHALEEARKALERATHAFAGRRMNRALKVSVGGRPLSEVAREVEHAKGIEGAHA